MIDADSIQGNTSQVFFCPFLSQERMGPDHTLLFVFSYDDFFLFQEFMTGPLRSSDCCYFISRT